MVPEPQPLLQDWVGRTYDWVLFQPLGILWFSFTFLKEMKQIVCLSTGDLWEAVNLTISVIFGSFITAKFTECCFCVVLFLYRRIHQNGEQYLKIIFVLAVGCTSGGQHLKSLWNNNPENSILNFGTWFLHSRDHIWQQLCIIPFKECQVGCKGSSVRGRWKLEDADSVVGFLDMMGLHYPGRCALLGYWLLLSMVSLSASMGLYWLSPSEAVA